VSAETRTTSATGGQKGVKLERFDLVPVGPLTALAAHFGRGAAKYDDNQWRKGYEWSKSYAAKQRHDNLFWAGFDYDVCENDPEGCAFVDQHGEPVEQFETEHGHGCYNHTTSHHLDASNWHGFVLREFTMTHPEHDDRYKPPVEERPQVAPPLYDPAYDLPFKIPGLPVEAYLQWKDPEPPSRRSAADALRSLVDVGVVSHEPRFYAGPPAETEDAKFAPFEQADLQPYLNEIDKAISMAAMPMYFISNGDGTMRRVGIVEYVNAALNRRD
jgi:hypothetical protein